MQSRASHVVMASAGSGKTTYLVDLALASKGHRVVMITYTNNNLAVIKRRLCECNGVVPARIDVRTWYEFLLRECVRPYQNFVYREQRVRSICFLQNRSARGVRKSDVGRFCFTAGGDIYPDKICHFIVECEKQSGGKVTRRLHELYDMIFLDEFQDMAGYDLEWLEVLMDARIPMVLVGDPRQSTFWTNVSAKNRQYRGVRLPEKLLQWEANGLCDIEGQSVSHRCNQQICDFADRLYPDFDKTKSLNTKTTGHDGIFIVPRAHLDAYVRTYGPKILRHSRASDTQGYESLNFGIAKGMTFDRVLIVPTDPIEEYLRTGDPKVVARSLALARFYVAVTRAKYSVAFLYEGECGAGYPIWQPE